MAIGSLEESFTPGGSLVLTTMMLCETVGESQTFVFAVEHAFLKEFSLAVGHIAHDTVCLSLIVSR